MADIGDKLRSAREAKGLSLADIEKATKIQSRYLSAIEQDDFDKLPGDFYVRAFIRQYAQIVGLDGKELLSEYREDVPKAEPDEYVEESIDNKSKEVQKKASPKRRLWKNYLPRIVIGLAVIVVVLVGYALYAHSMANQQSHKPENNDVTVASQNKTPKKKEKKEKKKVIKKNPVKIHRLASNQFRVTGLKNNRRLVVRAGQQAVTVTVAVNGITRWSQTLAAAQKHTMDLPADAQNFVVTFSNALGTAITVGGRKVPYDNLNSSLSLTFLLGNAQHQQATQNNHTNTQTNQNNTNTTNSNTGTTNSQNKQNNSSSQTQHSNNSQHSQSTQNNSQHNQNNSHSDNSSNSSTDNNNGQSGQDSHDDGKSDNDSNGQ
ncbi:helix-turn-helix domain-containing protein [Lactobacillus sp. ESL0791]|uniref:helix-turn-helix domain-containing protein n=1 Tax=Lactobacillus sp. ESL0791 TaxID=2983234 RepID=UPI0023F749A7|nr:RodZ family helix-turn-helix domain-containing protein [Lactobacillus sp. ESL0791]MDF7638563.1 helix-turn-helix domain-containing protein [Lactobacillus sp. ESL0791]